MPLVWQTSRCWPCPGLLLPPAVTAQLLNFWVHLLCADSFLGQVPSRRLQPDYFLRQQLDSVGNTHILAPAYNTSVGCPHPAIKGCPWWPPARKEATVPFHLEPQTPHIKLPPSTLSHQAPSWCTKTGLVSCCNSASIPPKSETVSSPCWHLQFPCLILLEHPPSFTCTRKGATPSPFFPIRKGKGKSNTCSPHPVIPTDSRLQLL